jgi:hypothetical protein
MGCHCGMGGCVLQDLWCVSYDGVPIGCRGGSRSGLRASSPFEPVLALTLRLVVPGVPTCGGVVMGFRSDPTISDGVEVMCGRASETGVARLFGKGSTVDEIAGWAAGRFVAVAGVLYEQTGSGGLRPCTVDLPAVIVRPVGGDPKVMDTQSFTALYVGFEADDSQIEMFAKLSSENAALRAQVEVLQVAYDLLNNPPPAVDDREIPDTGAVSGDVSDSQGPDPRPAPGSVPVKKKPGPRPKSTTGN